jgi:hypothetical protein
MQSMKTSGRVVSALVIVVSAWLGTTSASAQMPIPTNDTPTLHGGTPIAGMAVGGEIGYAALRGAFYYGRGTWDVALDAGIPTFGANDWLHGYNQSLGLDLRAPFRIRLAQWRIATGSLKVGPYFHVGRADWACDRRGVDRYCDGRRSIGTGALLGFVTDIALPKLFKLVVGIEQQFGMLNLHRRSNGDDYTVFAGATWIDLGLEAFWRDIFFTMIINVGAQYGSNNLHQYDHALFRQLFGVGYKFN